MKKKILALLMAAMMTAAMPADAILASETGTSVEIIWSDEEEEAASVSANASDMLDDDDMSVDADAS
ncbi:MAG: hypothetical protein LUD18_11720, partial [Lachnospiraceae bacterium]|nr:hypothetical protein [Lachnospiraceae bacterium]